MHETLVMKVKNGDPSSVNNTFFFTICFINTAKQRFPSKKKFVNKSIMGRYVRRIISKWQYKKKNFLNSLT